MTDQELIQAYLKGDDRAFNTLVRRYHKPVYNYLLKLVGSREDADDLAQTVFIRCCGNLKGLKDPQLFTPWLYRIAGNLARDHWRARKEAVSFDQFSEDSNPLAEIFVSDDDPLAAAAAGQRAEIVRKALLLIPYEQRETLILKIYQGLKFTEIAETLNEPLNTVKSRLYYGLTAMKKILQSWNLEELRQYEL